MLGTCALLGIVAIELALAIGFRLEPKLFGALVGVFAKFSEFRHG